MYNTFRSSTLTSTFLIFILPFSPLHSCTWMPCMTLTCMEAGWLSCGSGTLPKCCMRVCKSDVILTKLNTTNNTVQSTYAYNELRRCSLHVEPIQCTSMWSKYCAEFVLTKRSPLLASQLMYVNWLVLWDVLETAWKYCSINTLQYQFHTMKREIFNWVVHLLPGNNIAATLQNLQSTLSTIKSTML